MFSLLCVFAEPEDSVVLETAHSIYSKLGRHHDAMRVALQVCVYVFINVCVCVCECTCGCE
jgi:hypothetical protein